MVLSIEIAMGFGDVAALCDDNALDLSRSSHKILGVPHAISVEVHDGVRHLIHLKRSSGEENISIAESVYPRGGLCYM